MLQQFGPGLWLAEGGCVGALGGFRFPTRMAAIRLGQGELALWSPVRLTDELRAAVAGLGRPRHLIAPNHLHHLFLADWLAAFPGATLHLAPGLARKRPDLPEGPELSDSPPAAWAGVMDQAVIRGNLITTETVFFHRESRTALFTDLLQNFPAGWFPGWRGLIARADGMIGPRPAVPRKYRLAFVNRRAARQALRRVLDWPAEKVVAAHATPLTSGGQEALRAAFAFLGA